MRVRVNGVRLYFDADGEQLALGEDGPIERPTLIVLHGAPGVSDHMAFKPDFAALTDVAQILYLDLRGAGRSDDDPEGRYSLEGWADDIVEFCEVLGIEKPIVFGNSAGGMVAAVLGIRHPDHPGKLILSSTQARLNVARCAAVFERLGGEVAREAALDALQRRADMASLAVYNKHCMPLYNPTPKPKAFRNSAFRSDLALKFHGMGGIWHRLDHLEEMRRITCPTLVLAGAHDPVTPIEDSEDMVRHLDPSIVTYVPFENAGHGVWHDDPVRAFAVLRDFITAD